MKVRDIGTGLVNKSFLHTKTNKTSNNGQSDNVSFGYASSIKQMYTEFGLNCPCCGFRMVPNDFYTHTLKQFFREAQNNTAAKVVEVVSPYEDCLHPIEKDIFTKFRELQKYYPDNHCEDFIDTISINAEEASDFDTVKFLRDILPSQTSSSNWWKGIERRFTKKLLRGSVVSTEHIHERSTGGIDDLKNYLLQCLACNEKRGKTPFKEWLSLNPQMPENLQAYVNRIAELSNKYPMLDKNYSDELCQTLPLESGGKLRPSLQTVYA